MDAELLQQLHHEPAEAFERPRQPHLRVDLYQHALHCAHIQALHSSIITSGAIAWRTGCSCLNMFAYHNCSQQLSSPGTHLMLLKLSGAAILALHCGTGHMHLGAEEHPLMPDLKKIAGKGSLT